MASCLGDRKQVQIAGSTGFFFWGGGGVGGRGVKAAGLCSYCCSRTLWFYDGGRLGGVEIEVSSTSLWFTQFLFNMTFSRAKTFMRLKKTPALQAKVQKKKRFNGNFTEVKKKKFNWLMETWIAHYKGFPLKVKSPCWKSLFGRN